MHERHTVVDISRQSQRPHDVKHVDCAVPVLVTSFAFAHTSASNSFFVAPLWMRNIVFCSVLASLAEPYCIGVSDGLSNNVDICFCTCCSTASLLLWSFATQGS